MIRMILMTSLLMHVAKAFTKPYTNRSLGLILHRLVSTHNKSPKNDYIDVEIVNDDENSKKKAVSTKPIPTFFDSATYEKKSIEKKEEKKGIFSGIARFFGLDEKSQRKRKQRQEVNTAIDKVFQGTGLVGGLVGTIAKGVGGVLSELIVESSNDLEDVQCLVIDALERDSTVSDVLGERVLCDTPFVSSSSSMNFNGKTQKTCVYKMRVSGSRSNGVIDVKAESTGSTISITELTFQSAVGQVITVISAAGGRGGRANAIDVDSY